MWDVKKAFENTGLSAQKQMDMLCQVAEGVKQMQDELKSNCKYCNTCKTYYFKKECKVNSREVKKQVCLNPLTGGYLDPYEYEEREVTEYCYVCPKGHYIDGYVEWLDL